MNMSGQYAGYHPLGPPASPYEDQNHPHRQPNAPPNFPRHYNPSFPPNYPGPPRYFAEYSLWGNSHYNPSELIQSPQSYTAFGGLQQHPSPPYPPPAQFRPECQEDPPIPQPSVPPDAVTQTEDEAVGGSEEPELTGLEDKVKTVVSKEELYKPPEVEGESDIDEKMDTIERASNSSGSSADWPQNVKVSGGYPPAFPWASRPARVVNNRGRKANIMQRRLVRALSQPVKVDKAASMMQRMGWTGGGLGRDESGIVEPIAPNALYSNSTAGFGLVDPEPPKKAKKIKKVKIPPRKKNNEHFKTNILQIILGFVKDDLLLELYFDAQLKSNERKRIHRLVSALDDDEQEVVLTSTHQQEVVNDIHRRNKYILATQSEGEGDARQICVYKSAPSHMFLVTPDDCRPCLTEIKEIEEEPNPFLKSITNHIRKDEGTILKPKAPHLIDKLIQFFIDFCGEEAFTEFRFLGPFTEKEIHVINNFFHLVSDLGRKKKPLFKVPVELLDVFVDREYRFISDPDSNGFMTIQKVPFNLKKEFDKQQEAKREEKRRDQRVKMMYLKKYIER